MSSAAETDQPPKLSFPAPLGAEGKEDEKPKRGPGRPKGSTNRNVMGIAKIEESLNTQFTMIGTMVYAFNQYDGTVILQGSPKLASSLASLCEKNPKVRRNIERMLAGGSYGEVIVAAGLIAVPIMANHGLMPPGIRQLYGQAIPPTEEEKANGSQPFVSEPLHD